MGKSKTKNLVTRIDWRLWRLQWKRCSEVPQISNMTPPHSCFHCWESLRKAKVIIFANWKSISSNRIIARETKTQSHCSVQTHALHLKFCLNSIYSTAQTKNQYNTVISHLKTLIKLSLFSLQTWINSRTKASKTDTIIWNTRFNRSYSNQ